MNTHGHTKGTHVSPTYKAWTHILWRCNNPKCPEYRFYGARGIKVHWKAFEDFLADMGEKPKGLTIERIDNNGNYCKENCRWATMIEQANNKRNNRHISFNGETKTLAQWARSLGIHSAVLLYRLKTWTLERALTTPRIPNNVRTGRKALLVLAIALFSCVTVNSQTVEVWNIFGKVDDANWRNPAKQIFFAGGGVGRWMTVGRIDTTSPDQKGFSPNWTYVLVKYMPVVKQMPNGDYQITFTSKFTKDLP